MGLSMFHISQNAKGIAMKNLDEITITLTMTVREANKLSEILTEARKSIDPFNMEELGVTYSLFSCLNRELLDAYTEVDVIGDADGFGPDMTGWSP